MRSLETFAKLAGTRAKWRVGRYLVARSKGVPAAVQFGVPGAKLYYGMPREVRQTFQRRLKSYISPRKGRAGRVRESELRVLQDKSGPKDWVRLIANRKMVMDHLLGEGNRSFVVQKSWQTRKMRYGTQGRRKKRNKV